MQSQLIPLNIFLLGAISLCQSNLACTKPNSTTASTVPLDLNRLKRGAVPNYSVTTGNIRSQPELIIPRLWWTKEQFGDKLVDNWLVIPNSKKILDESTL
jgi:hypothetical protein